MPSIGFVQQQAIRLSCPSKPGPRAGFRHFRASSAPPSSTRWRRHLRLACRSADREAGPVGDFEHDPRKGRSQKWASRGRSGARVTGRSGSHPQTLSWRLRRSIVADASIVGARTVPARAQAHKGRRTAVSEGGHQHRSFIALGGHIYLQSGHGSRVSVKSRWHGKSFRFAFSALRLTSKCPMNTANLICAPPICDHRSRADL